MQKKTVFGLIAAAACLGVAGIVSAYFLWPTKPTVVVDRLCEFVRDQQQLDCVSTLASDTFVHPGSIIDYRPSESPNEDRLPLPIADITNGSCLVPGTPELETAIKVPSAVSIPQLSFETNRALEVGANIELPQLYGANIKAGPQWSEVEKVALSVDEAWITQLDENLAIKAVQSCSIRKECVDRIKSQQYRVIATSLVAKGLSYRFYDKSGSVLSMNAAAKADMFSASLGASSDVQATTDATLKATEPRVVGLRLLPADIFANQPVCDRTIVFSADGNATVSIAGGGGKGNIGALQRVSKRLNEAAQLSATGGESSECDDDFERKRSGASAMAKVDSTAEGSLRFAYDIAAHGGHYVTAATCALGNVIGKTGHDTTAIASADLVGTIFIVVRSEGEPLLNVAWKDMPATGAEIRVLDWRNEPLPDPKGSLPTGAVGVASGAQDYVTKGAGLYRVETRIQLSRSVGGNVDETSHQSADVTVTVGGNPN